MLDGRLDESRRLADAAFVRKKSFAEV